MQSPERGGRSLSKARVKLLPAEDLPEFASDDEAADWYDTHDTSALPTEEVPAARGDSRGMETVAIRISPRELVEIKRRAERLGIGHTTYIRLLINHHVLAEAELPQSAQGNPMVVDPEWIREASAKFGPPRFIAAS